MEEKTRYDAADDLAYFRAEAELAAHTHDPLDAELCVLVQPLTITRLDRYRAATGQSRDELVNMILGDWLYGEGRIMSNYYDTRQKNGRWYIVGSMDGANWYYVYEHLFSFATQDDARAWLIAEGYTQIGERIERAVAVRKIEDAYRVTREMLGELREKR